MPDACKHCGGDKNTRNPTGTCDHLYWPDCLTDEAKRANGFVQKTVVIWRSSMQPEIVTYSPLDMAEAARIAVNRSTVDVAVTDIGRLKAVEIRAIAAMAYENAAILAERLGADDVAAAIRELMEGT